MKAKEIREMSEKDLRDRIAAEVAAFEKMKLNHAVSPLEHTSDIKKARKDITRMKTVLTEIEKSKK